MNWEKFIFRLALVLGFPGAAMMVGSLGFLFTAPFHQTENALMLSTVFFLYGGAWVAFCWALHWVFSGLVRKPETPNR